MQLLFYAQHTSLSWFIFYFVTCLCMLYESMKTAFSHPKWNECSHDTASYSGKATCHHSMDLRFGHVLQIGADQQRRFSLMHTNTCKTIKKHSNFEFLLYSYLWLPSKAPWFIWIKKNVAKGCKEMKSHISTCPTNILPATLKVSVGEVPIVICITHEICVDKNTDHSISLCT